MNKRYAIVIYDEPYSDASIEWIELSFTRAATIKRMKHLINQERKTLELYRLKDGAFYPVDWSVKRDSKGYASEIEIISEIVK